MEITLTLTQLVIFIVTVAISAGLFFTGLFVQKFISKFAGIIIGINSIPMGLLSLTVLMFFIGGNVIVPFILFGVTSLPIFRLTIQVIKRLKIIVKSAQQ